MNAFRYAGELIDCGQESLFSEQRCHTWADIAAIATIATAAASISTTAYAASQPAPKSPDLRSSSRQVAQAQADALPGQRAMAAAMQQGGTGSVHIGRHREDAQFIKYQVGSDSLYDKVLAGDSGAIGNKLLDIGTGGIASAFGFGGEDKFKYIEYKPEDWKPGGKYYVDGRTNDKWLQSHLTTRSKLVKEHDQNYDFKGYGTADIQGDLARQMADKQQALAAKYGVQFAEQARKEAELSDPQGFAARAKELELIQKGINEPMPINPLATTLDDRMKSRLEAGNNLDGMSRDLLDKAIARSNADRGGNTSAGDVASLMGSGMEGAARRQAAIGQGQSWLSSGATPEDTAYRREQANLANLGSFVSGQTPQSQFQNLSGAGNGASPFFPGNSGPQMPGNAAQVGGQYGVSSYLANLRAQQNSPNAWMAGLSSLLGGIGTLGSMGGQSNAAAGNAYLNRGGN